MKTPTLRCRISLFMFFLLPVLSIAQKTPQQIEEMKRKILADPEVATVKVSPKTQSPFLIQLKLQSKAYDKSEAKPVLENFLSVRPGTDLLKMDKTSRTGSMEVLEFQQYFKGIKVDRAKYKALLTNGNVSLYSGAWYNVPADLGIAPSLTMKQALDFAKARVNAILYAEDDIQQKINTTSDTRIKNELKKELAEASSKGELVIIKDFNWQGIAEMKLAYKFNIYAAQPLSRAWVYVDAHTGKILLYDPIIKHAGTPTSVNTTVRTRYAGDRVIKTKQISGTDPHNGGLLISSHPANEIYIPGTATWVLVDDSRGKGIETYDLNGVGGLPLSVPYLYIQGRSFTDVDNNWTLAEHKRGDPLLNGTGQDGAFEMENDDIAWDAHWGASMVYDYWLSHHNRKSFDDRDGKIKSFIHYGPAYDNAFWNGTAMTYGDGSGTVTGFKALTSLDVCGHEIGHGVCSYTSDLVYEKESGAMNEALSDIWASCIERFAIVSVDNTLATVYRPFYIGEQIGATPDNPLRRMDNPKAASNPDTYGGQYWSSPDCAPDLVNDYCGVHNNSGVLNKWFYLITVGSGAGSGPDAQFARTDSDDGVNDLGNTYSVTGSGFDISEKVVYLMEMMLSSTATYAEAREASIAAATVISGDACSPTVQSVTNAWYAVGVGGAYDPASCISTYGFVFRPGTSVNEASGGNGCAAEYEVRVKLLLPANSTAAITSTGTASNNIDYRIPITSLSNTTGANAIKEVSVFVKNDAVIESNETISLNVSITNTGASPVNSSYAINITEDDIVPVIGSGSSPLLSNDFSGIANGYNLPAGWSTANELAGNNMWGTWDGQLKITPSVNGIALLPGTYDNTSATSTIAYTPLIDATGLSSIKLSFDYNVQGEVDVNGLNPENFGVFDYMAIVYSFDGMNFTEFNLTTEGFGPFCSATPTSGTFEMTLPAFLANRKFYIGFKWSNDTNAGGPVSASVDNVNVSGANKTIENDAGHNGRELVLPGQEVNFYSIQDGEVLAKLKNNSTKNYGCTNVYVERTGNGAFNLYYGNDGLQKVADKVIRVEPSAIYKASTTLSFYYTEAQIAALEQATNKSRTSFLVYHVAAASYAAAAQKNTKKYVPAYTAIPGAGGIFTITVSNDEPIGSFALGATVSVLGAKEPMANTQLNANTLSVYPNPVKNNAFFTVTAGTRQEIKIEVINTAGQVVYVQKEVVQKGTSTVKIDASRLSSGTYLLRTSAADGSLNKAQPLIKL
jgi:Zn-dependent metalloprotease